jgi:hypothetical protein
MFVENHRLDTMIGGSAPSAVPYPHISDEDWQKWKAFLPVKAVPFPFSKKMLLRISKSFLKTTYGIPPDVYNEMVRAADHFQEIEIWGKRQINKDPIAVGITQSGERHLICRWGPDKLVPFERIKSRSWLYRIQNLGVSLFSLEQIWLSTAAAALLGMAYLGLVMYFT